VSYTRLLLSYSSKALVIMPRFDCHDRCHGAQSRRADQGGWPKA
jgi:hypothetical protein